MMTQQERAAVEYTLSNPAFRQQCLDQLLQAHSRGSQMLCSLHQLVEEIDFGTLERPPQTSWNENELDSIVYRCLRIVLAPLVDRGYLRRITRGYHKMMIEFDPDRINLELFRKIVSEPVDVPTLIEQLQSQRWFSSSLWRATDLELDEIVEFLTAKAGDLLAEPSEQRSSALSHRRIPGGALMTRSMIDNWLLELVDLLMDRRLQPPSRRLRVAKDRNHRSDHHLRSWTSIAKDALVALFQLLDLVVLNDELIYDVKWAHTWNQSERLSPIAPLLRPIKIGIGTRRKLAGDWDVDIPPDSPAIVRDGALYYLNLSRLLGVYYWPSPKRAEYLKAHMYSEIGSGFLTVLREYVDSNLREMLCEALAPLDLPEPYLDFPGFGSSILANCDTRESILETAMEFRGSKECQAFRGWLKEMDSALQLGNLAVIARNIRDVKDVLGMIQADTGLQEKAPSDKIEFEIGLSPTLAISLESAKSLFHQFRRRPYHIAFLRCHFTRVLKNTNLSIQAIRLFPELTNRESKFL
jgi:hypothetical protein